MNMMLGRCARIQRKLLLLLAECEGRLPSSGAIHEHLEECDRCRNEARRLHELLGNLGSDAIPDPGEAYWQAFLPRLRNRLASEGVTGKVRAGWTWALAATAASFLLAGFSLGQWKAPVEARARLSLEQAARESDPESLQRALDTLLPDPDPIAAPAGRHDDTAQAAEMERTLEVVLPRYETDADSAMGDAASAQTPQLEQSLDPGWV